MYFLFGRYSPCCYPCQGKELGGSQFWSLITNMCIDTHSTATHSFTVCVTATEIPRCWFTSYYRGWIPTALRCALHTTCDTHCLPTTAFPPHLPLACTVAVHLTPHTSCGFTTFRLHDPTYLPAGLDVGSAALFTHCLPVYRSVLPFVEVLRFHNCYALVHLPRHALPSTYHYTTWLPTLYTRHYTTRFTAHFTRTFRAYGFISPRCRALPHTLRAFPGSGRKS